MKTRRPSSTRLHGVFVRAMHQAKAVASRQGQQGPGNGDARLVSSTSKVARSESTVAQFARVNVAGLAGGSAPEGPENEHPDGIDDEECNQYGEAERQRRLQTKQARLRPTGNRPCALADGALRCRHSLFLQARSLQVRLRFCRPFEEQL